MVERMFSLNVVAIFASVGGMAATESIRSTGSCRFCSDTSAGPAAEGSAERDHLVMRAVAVNAGVEPMER